MNLLPTDRFNSVDEVLSQEVNGETVLPDLSGENYFGLDEVGTRIWQLLQADNTVVELLDAVADEYEVGREQLGIDVYALLARLVDAGLIKQVSD